MQNRALKGFKLEYTYKVVDATGKIMEKFRYIDAAHNWMRDNQLDPGEFKTEKL